MIVYGGKTYMSCSDASRHYGRTTQQLTEWVLKGKLDVLDLEVFCDIVLNNIIAPEDLKGRVYIDTDSIERMIMFGYRPGS